MKTVLTVLCTAAILLLTLVAQAQLGSGNNGSGFCSVAEGLLTGKRHVIEVELVKKLGTNEIMRSETERSRLSGKFQLKLDPDPANKTWPYRVVAADLVSLSANSMKLVSKASSGELAIGRDLGSPVDGGYNPATAQLWASIPVGFTAESFMADDDWVLPGELDAGL